jgi:enamine deaminase RidA (YjgF/YER057c/UK114 family)
MRRFTPWLVSASLALNVVFLLGAASERADRRYLSRSGSTIKAPFSDGVLVGDTLYLAGKLGLEPGTRTPPEAVEREVRLALDSMKATLAEAGMTMDDLVSVQVFSPHLELYDQFNKVYRSYFGDHPPARAFVGSGPLLFGARFEIQGTAVRR